MRIVWLVAGSVSLCCTPSAAPADPDTRAPPVEVHTASPAAPAAPEATASPSSSAGSSSDPARFACGKSTCRSGKDTCCLSGNEGVCLPSAPDDAPPSKIGQLRTQSEVCDQATLKQLSTSLSGIDRCDESIDCENGAVCCDQFLFSGATIGECVKLPKSGQTPCEYGERCINDATCRLPGTKCSEGYCQKPVPQLRCDKTVCSGSTPVCCGDPAGCQAAAACESYKRVHCTQNGDCVPGHTCAVADSGVVCTGILISGGHQPVCTRDGDCTERCAGGKRAACLPSQVAWLKSCQCP